MEYKGRYHYPPRPLSKPMTEKRGKRFVNPPDMTAQRWCKYN